MVIIGRVINPPPPKPPTPPVPAGATILFTDGCYSSYGVTALAKAKQELDLVALRARWGVEQPNRPGQSPFVAWLEAQGLIDEIAYFEAWSDDGDFDVYDRDRNG